MRDLAGGGVVVSRGYRSQALSARRPGGVKPLSPLLAQAEPQLKPPSPLLACSCVGLKPPSPLRVRNGRLWCVFRAQRCRRFQRPRVGGEQWCCWFQCRLVSACCARYLSPASPAPSVVREIVSPANPKWVKSAVVRCAGRVFRGTAGPHGGRVVRPQCLRPPLTSRGGNVACHSPQGIPSCELKSLKFCRLQSVVDVGSEGIACDL